MVHKRRFEKMYEQYADEIFRYTLLYVKDRELAEDITSDTFVRAWKHIATFDNKQPRAWLYSIARNLMNDHWRKTPTVLIEDDDEFIDDKQSPHADAEKTFTNELVYGALDTLPTTMRAVVFMRFIEGKSARGVAEALKTTEENVRVLQFRALKKLRKIL